MKRKVLAMLVPALLVAGAANAAEVYNKDGNKLDLYGKVAGLHYFSDDAGSDGDKSYARIGFKGETQIADQFTGYGQWEYNLQANGTEGDGDNSATRLAFAGLGFGQNGTFDMVVTTVSYMTSKHGPICCQNLVAIPMLVPTIS